MAPARFLVCVVGFLIPSVLVGWPAKDWSDQETAGFYGRPVAVNIVESDDNDYSRHVVCHANDRALWVAYVIEAESFRKEGDPREMRPRAGNRFSQVGKFHTEAFKGYHPRFPNESIHRGHLAPDAALKWFGTLVQGDRAQKDTYKTDNIVPQIGRHNSGVWKRLEEDLRAASTTSSVWVVVGGTYDEDLYLNDDKASAPPIPTRMFCAVLVRNSDGALGAVGILIEHVPTAERKIMSIDELEAIVGINFFPELGSLAEVSLEIPRYKNPRKTLLRMWHLK